MNQKQLEQAIAEQAGLSRAEANAAINAVLDSIEQALRRNESVVLRNIGTLRVEKAAATRRFSPRDSVIQTENAFPGMAYSQVPVADRIKIFVDVPEKLHVRFKPSDKLEDGLNSK